ncbi:A/G-specific adenine glycosylase [Echinicola jeungdonensis]|uniref:A/G-specific adenine glycosylase n=1 Tax=Echinicola jeungdonensis TaxID=709343 RepID=UPI0025B4ED08|nr:A/G-specific adenine glycosylase [Echinicola jeungdonensis]MDN3669248.1 A/G-specific adenine glycosylase [Echinicola jeungdonensis]
MNFSYFANKLLQWYPQNKRNLPWRDTQNPYIIWLSEIILQQTRVAQGLPYFEKFLKEYPSVQDLAQAPMDEVMRLWQGLGYYSRARNLHQCAKEVTENFEGYFPDNYKDLLQLKGVGSYTAAAIASFAFKERVAVLDGNVFRVLSRYFGLGTDISSTQGKKEFEKLANQIIPENEPDQYNQAIMEFGALQCSPKNPDCSICPLQKGCFAHKHHLIDQLPYKAKKIKVTTRAFLYHHITCGEHVIARKRGPKDIWQGLFDFPLTEFSNPGEINPEASQLGHELQSFNPTIRFDSEKTYKHILTHQKIFSNFASFQIPEEHFNALEQWARKNGYFPCTRKQLEDLGKPKLIVRYLNDKK